MTYEEKLAEYNEFMSYDKITGAYARLFCDYMGIVAALFSVFVPVAFLIRDKRAKVNELIFSRDISSMKLILTRYAAMVFMMLIPFIVLSLFPSIYLINFALKNNMSVDIFAFMKYIIAWILPTLMTTAAVALIITTITDTPLAIAIQFIWSFISLTVGGFAAYNGGTGDLIHYGMNLLIRHNTTDNLQYYRDNLTQIAVNRIFYTVLSIILVVLTIFIYEQKRRGEIDVRGSLRKIFRNRKKAG
jgi:ABC-type transport system involved in multi-copper enzyme maturation permease subunit